MHTTINGQPCDYEVHADESAVELIRDRAGLTGTKLVCGAGVCGACTVLLDGKPVVSCLLPADALEDRSVQTIEGWGPELHPVQRAFMAHDALQCGFCTPGFVNEGIAFYERWRQEHGNAEPTREEVAAALAGHLCRCGAYPGIYAAVQRACAGDFESGEVVPPRVEAREKVNGSARYTVDVRLNGQQEGRILRSPHAHARVLSIDVSEARAMDGVSAVVEMLDNERIVRYVGQEVAAVAAVDYRTAEAALSRIKVQYEVLPAAIGMEAARASDAPTVFAGRKNNVPSSGEGMMIPGRWQNNVRSSIVSLTARQAGKARARIAQARAANDRLLVAGRWCTNAQSHTTLEPHSSVADWKDEQLTVYASTQACHRLARQIAEHFKLPAEKVQVLCEHIGGGFGSKLDLTPETIAAVMLSRAAGAPVRVVLDRGEELTVGGYRPSADIELSLLTNQAGDLQALSANVYSDGGISIGSQVAVLMGLMYPGSPRDLVDYDVVNHVAPGKPFRGPGGPLASWALEQAIDEAAHRLNMDSVALRRRWDSDPLRHKLYDWAESIPAWRERGAVGGDRGRYRRGIGLSMANWFYFFHSATQIEVRSTADGISVTTAAQDMGNGSRTVLAQAVAEIFGIAPTDVIVHIGDSRAVRGPLSGGSRTTNSVFAPAQRAATKVRQQLVQAAVQHFKLQDARVVNGGIDHARGHLPWREVFSAVPSQTATVARGRDRGIPAMPLAIGADNLSTGRGITSAVHITELEVDTRLGKIRPLRVWGCIAAGKIIVPTLARSQCYGAVIQGLGYALYEQKFVDRASGHTLTRGLEDYRIPGIGDIPEIEIAFIEEGFEHAQGKGVGISELATVGMAASVGNAVFHATGWRPYQLPIQPEAVIQGVRA
jgi:xanthine dehydrogenase YagR molybdenum-binding subunit